MLIIVDLILREVRLICKSYQQYNMYEFMQKQQVSKQGQYKQYTIAEIVSNCSKDNPQLTTSYLTITNQKNQQLKINSCIQQIRYWYLRRTQTLLFIWKKQTKIIVGKILINKEKVKLKNHDNLFDQFVQKHLQLKSSYHEVKALKEIKLEVEKKNQIQDQVQNFYYLLKINFRSGQVWTFQFDELKTAQSWWKLLNEFIENQKKQKEQIQNKFKQMITQYPALLKQIEKLTQDLHKKNVQTRQLEVERATNRELNTQIEQLKEKSRINEEEKQKLIENYQKHSRQLIQIHQQKLKELEDKIESQNKDIDYQKKENSRLQEQFTKQKQKLQAQIRRLNISLQIAQQTNTTNQKLIIRKSDQIASLTQQLTRRQNSQAQLQKQLKTLKESHQIYFRKSEDQKRELNLGIRQLEEQAYLHIFQGNLLHQSSFQKEFLRNQVEKYTQRKIQYTKLLYRYDTLNKVNFHKYIDQHPNICVVIKLQNGMSIAGYSQDSVSQQKIASKGGFLSSLTNMVSFELNEGCRSVSYDDYFLIFGNSELRIRSLELLLFSNFAINNGYFDSRGQKYNILMGIDASRTERIHDYEIFQIIFK